jgi:hypothetical protein
MKFVMAMAVALLVLGFVDGRFNDGIYTSAVASMVLQIRYSVGV